MTEGPGSSETSELSKLMFRARIHVPLLTRVGCKRYDHERAVWETIDKNVG
jgi:hypothetical protein